jgi:phosphatidylserine/phosphatidylglycerophosphate/cardiolipin synthase-like enzyme
MKIRRVLAVASMALLLLSIVPLVAQGDDDVQLVTLQAVASAIQHAHVVTISAYTLAPTSRIGKALIRAAQAGAQISLVLDGEGLAGANRANEANAAIYSAAGVRVRITHYKLHMKAIVVDGSSIYVSDRNWSSSGSSVIFALPVSTRIQVERAILGQPSSNGTFATRKSDALSLEAALLAQRRSHVVLVETESFSRSPVSDIIEQRARAGDDVTLVVAASEYRGSRKEQETLSELAQAGVHVFLGKSDEKIAIDGTAGFAGSANQSAGWGDQVDWGIVFANPDVVSTLAQHVRDDSLTPVR